MFVPINYLKVLTLLRGKTPFGVGLVLGIGCTSLGLSVHSCSISVTYSDGFCCGLMPFLSHNCLPFPPGTLASEANTTEYILTCEGLQAL